MRRESNGQIVSFWEETSHDFPCAALNKNEEADVCVVGAGIAGLSAAYHLCRAGKSVVILDDGSIGWGETGRSSAHLSYTLDERFFDLEKIHGKEKIHLVIDSHLKAIETIESISSQENIFCDFQRVDGLLMLDFDESPDVLYREMKASMRLGLDQIKIISSRILESGIKSRAFLRFPNQAQFHPIKYLNGLAGVVQKNGVRIYTRTHAQAFEPRANGVVVHTDRLSTVRARDLIVATNSPVNNLLKLHLKQAAYRSYMIVANIPRDSVKKNLYWDLKNPFHYVRVIEYPQSEHFDYIAIGGEDHKTGQAHNGDERFEQLEFWARSHVPQIDRILYRWSGQVMQTFDGLAFIGRNPGDQENIYISTGDSGMGLTYGTIAGLLLTDLIMGRENSWQQIYDPARIPFKSVMHATKENLNAASQYFKWVAPNQLTNLQDISYGSGGLVRDGLKLNAVYRDSRGNFFSFSATCPHLGGVVEWNEVENTWDCPCHGSRFSCKGEILNGPANRNLTPRPLMIGVADELGVGISATQA